MIHGEPFLSLGVNHIQNVFKERVLCLETKGGLREILQRLTYWGYNTGGTARLNLCADAYSFAPMYLTKNANYMSDKEFEYCDVFDPVVQQKMREVIQYEIGKQAGINTDWLLD